MNISIKKETLYIFGFVVVALLIVVISFSVSQRRQNKKITNLAEKQHSTEIAVVGLKMYNKEAEKTIEPETEVKPETEAKPETVESTKEAVISE